MIKKVFSTEKVAGIKSADPCWRSICRRENFWTFRIYKDVTCSVFPNGRIKLEAYLGLIGDLIIGYVTNIHLSQPLLNQTRYIGTFCLGTWRPTRMLKTLKVEEYPRKCSNFGLGYLCNILASIKMRAFITYCFDLCHFKLGLLAGIQYNITCFEPSFLSFIANPATILAL